MKKIKLFDPVTTREEEVAAVRTLRSNFWASGAGLGNVLKFEREFKKYTKTKKCVAVNNGTAALHLALSLMNIKNKEVILPSLSFISTAHAIVYNGGIPIFVDVKPDTLCIDPKEIEKVVSKKTKVVLPVHFAGMSCELDDIMRICKDQNAKLVEDAAHAAGSFYKNKKIGSHGNVVCFSFHPVKNLAMPTGGAITLNDKESEKLDEILRSLRWCGISDREGVHYDVTRLGWNYYMNEVSAAIGSVQLKKLDRMNNIRKTIAKKYSKEINLDEKMPFNNECSYHFYWILVKNRSKFMKKLFNLGIETGIHYKPIHKMQYYDSKIRLETTDRIGEQIVSIPIHPNLSESDIFRIISCINEYS